jgi:cytochrome c oxidase subunit 3
MSNAAPFRTVPYLGPQFDDAAQQNFAARLGMWFFLATEVLFFGGMFVGYAVYRSRYSSTWEIAGREMDVWVGTLNTAILLTSSLAIAWAVHAVRIRQMRTANRALMMTILLGTSFLMIKGWEYFEKWQSHHVPGPYFVWPNAQEAGAAELFFSFYFGMTGCHALHMIIGLGMLLFLLRELRRGVYASGYDTPLEMTALYWHFVDCIWVVLFPLFYLLDRSAGG